MNRLVVVALIAGIAMVLVPSARAEGDAETLRGLMEQKAPTIVTVKFVLKVHIQMGVQEQDREINREVSGVMVSPDGLVMVSNSALSAGRAPNPQIRLTSTPTDFKVLFEDDEEEYEAVLGATDSRLDLAFVAMKDPKKRAISAVDFAAAGKVQVGQSIIGISRFARGFDYAPFMGTLMVTGKVAKPRKMFSIGGSFNQIGMVLYDLAGAPVGVLAVQEAASGGGRAVFLLPADIVKATIKQAATSAKEVLEQEPVETPEKDEGEGTEETPKKDEETEEKPVPDKTDEPGDDGGK